MKVLIWVGCVFLTAIVNVFLKRAGLNGAIPMMISFGAMWSVASYLCRKYDERHKKDSFIEQINDINTDRSGFDSDNDHRWRCSCGNMISSEPCPYCSGDKSSDNMDGQSDSDRSSADDFSGAKAIALSYNKRLKVIHTVLIVILVLIIVLWNVDVKTHNTKTVPIEYTELTYTSSVSDNCYTDVYGAIEAFDMKYSASYNGRPLYSSGSTATYYMAYDEDGLSCLLHVYSYNTDELEKMLASDVPIRIYGTCAAAPKDYQSDPYDTYDDFLDRIQSGESVEDIMDEITNGDYNNDETKEFVDELFSKYKILSVSVEPSFEKEVNDGYTMIYLLKLSGIALLLIAEIAVFIYSKTVHKRGNDAVIAEIIRVKNLKEKSEELQ